MYKKNHLKRFKFNKNVNYDEVFSKIEEWNKIVNNIKELIKKDNIKNVSKTTNRKKKKNA